MPPNMLAVTGVIPFSETIFLWQSLLLAAILIAVTAAGYFVDIYDLLLFSIVRVKSLRELGIPESELLSTGVLLINLQMAGLLVGGLFWGVLGDRRGRLKVLFGSILLWVPNRSGDL